MIPQVTKRDTAQNIFETSVRHMIKQGTRALNAELDACMYRGNDGTKCAIGCLIEDDEYDEAMEGIGIAGLINTSVFMGLFKWARPHRRLMMNLQDAHDHALRNGAQSVSFIQSVKDIAIDSNLDYTFIRELINPETAKEVGI